MKKSRFYNLLGDTLDCVEDEEASGVEGRGLKELFNLVNEGRTAGDVAIVEILHVPKGLWREEG